MVAIGERELARSRRSSAPRRTGSQPGTRSAEAPGWTVRKNHPKTGRGRRRHAAHRRFADGVRRRRTASRRFPPDERVIVAPALPFDLGFASMHASPPLEKTPVKSVFYITDAQPDLSPAEQEAWLERYNYASLSNTAAHEAMPGHWLHSTYMRRTPGKVRRIWIGLNPFPQPSSGQDGWAHYAEQMVLDEGYRQQRSEAASRAGERRADAHLPVALGHQAAHEAVDARRRAALLREGRVRRGAGRAARGRARRVRSDVRRLLPRQDARFSSCAPTITKRMGAKFNLREFHERFMTNGIAPIWAQRQLLLPGDTRRSSSDST